MIVNWRIVEAAEHLSGPDKGALMDNHKALGITILVLSIGRLLWRWTHPVAPLPATLAKWERVLARFVHLAFYVLLIGLPLGGWLAGSYVERGVDLFGIATLPPLPVGMNEDMAKTIIGFHKTGGEILLYLIALHILGALKHTFFDKSGVLWRMLPFGKAA